MQPNTSRAPLAHPVVVALLILILLALLGILAMSIWGRSDRKEAARAPDRAQPSGAAQQPQPQKQEHLKDEPPKPEPPKPVGDPQRVRNVLQPGKTYETIMKMGLEATVMDKDWGIRKTCHLNYVFESRVRRTVKHNDGRTIRLDYRMVECRAVKVLSSVQVRFDLGELERGLLGALDEALLGGAGKQFVQDGLSVVYKIFDSLEQKKLEKKETKVFSMIDSLEGKNFSITYVDGEGVTEIIPIDCQLSEDERNYLEGLSVLADCKFLPDVESRPGSYWDVEAHALMDFLPPSWRGRPSGVVTIERVRDYKQGETQYAVLKMDRGSFQVNASDATRRRLGSLTPRGEMHYNITAGYVEKGELQARGQIQEVSTDHLLFEARFESTPNVTIQYHCRILGE